ncbi:Fungal-trans domain-containing protein [Mycena venus]|uniref:Fungal-trans domain-containing protein n=1 Tax=Mycena venus TaxID=2733690 RepID=A0A8H7CGS5_9AGAR|nr:Fungal-trans domain-containing protein [Mycena venus]
MPGNRCTNCLMMYVECTHTRAKGVASSPSGASPKTAQEYVEAILSESTVYVPSHDPDVSHRILVEVARYARNLEEKLAAIQLQTLVPLVNSPKDKSPSPRTSEGPQGTANSELPIEDALRGLTLFGANKNDRFYGQSSSVQFVKTAMKHIHGNASHVVGVQRPEFWSTQPWEMLTIEAPQQIFPENDLLKSLIKIYFEQLNPILSILHFPSFHRSVLDGLHFRDQEFGAVVLAVCSLASRYSDDPRVFLDGTDSEHSCGWKWFRQVRPHRATFSPEPSLYQLQLLVLSAVYTAGTSAPEECWILASLGIRFAQGAGAHHRQGYSHMDLLTAELYKRVFWLLVIVDTFASSFKGRPSTVKSTDFDLELPLDCDDEYWGTPNPVQPSGKLSTAAFLPCFAQLMLIFGRIQGAVYLVNGQLCSENVIAELDSLLNKWVDTIPEHLKWDPHQRNQIFLDQSAALYCAYYHSTQILIHRPFIPAPGKQATSKAGIVALDSTGTYSSQTRLPSLAICANAARSCGHVLDVQARRGRGLLSHPNVLTALFDCAVVLLVNVWAVVGGGRRSRTPDDFTRATADAQNCVRVLRLYERRWRSAGRKWDIISALLNIGKYTSDAQSLKRGRDMEEEPPSSDESEACHHPLQGSKSSTPELLALERSIQETDHLFSLPLLTEELGRLPVYDSFDYEPTFQSNEDHQPQSHLVSENGASGLELELIYRVDSTINSSSPAQEQTRIAGDAHIQVPPLSFDIPMGYGWQDWSNYLANVEGLSQVDY